MDIRQNEMRIKRRIIKERKFSMINKDPEETGKLLLEALKDPECVTKCEDLVESRRTKFPLIKTKLKSHFKVIEKLSKVKNLDTIKSIIKKCSEENYHQFMSCFEKQRVTKRDKEYYARLRFYSDLNRDVAILSNLSVTLPEYGDTVTIDKEIINKKVAEEY